jgi:hypothetical protein
VLQITRKIMGCVRSPQSKPFHSFGRKCSAEYINSDSFEKFHTSARARAHAHTHTDTHTQVRNMDCRYENCVLQLKTKLYFSSSCQRQRSFSFRVDYTRNSKYFSIVFLSYILSSCPMHFFVNLTFFSYQIHVLACLLLYDQPS